MVKQVNDGNFQREVIEASKTKPVLVDFYADWCGPCQVQGPIVESLAGSVGESAVIAKCNTEDSSKTAEEFNILSIPTLIIFKDGTAAERFTGLQSKESLETALKKHI